MRKFEFPVSAGFVYKNVRLTNKLDMRLKKMLIKKQVSFSDFVSSAIEYTLDAIDEQEKLENK